MTYIGCGKLGYCAYATDEYIQSGLDSKGYGAICLNFYKPGYNKDGFGEVETKINWRGKTYNNHVALFNPINMSLIDPLYNKKFNMEEYFQFIIPKIEWVEEKDKVLCFGVQMLSCTNYDNDGRMVSSRWDPTIPSLHFVYKNKQCFSEDEAERVLNEEYKKLR